MEYLPSNSRALEERADNLYEILEGEVRSPEAVIALQGLHQVVLEQSRIIHDTQSRLATAERLSLTDPLTELGNRRAYDRDIENWAVRFDRGETVREEDVQEGTHALLIIGDLDAFKLINDVLGYNYGDHILCFVAHALKKSVRHQDGLYRIGGDEFAIIAPVLPNKETAAYNIISQRFYDNISLLREGDDQIPKNNLDIEALNVLDVTFASGLFMPNHSKDDLIKVSEDTMRIVKEQKEAKSASLR